MHHLFFRTKHLLAHEDGFQNITTYPIQKLSPQTAQFFLVEEIDHSDYVIVVSCSYPLGTLEHFLVDREILFLRTHDEENDTYQYQFLNYYVDYQPFSAKNAFQAYQLFRQETTYSTDAYWFDLAFFQALQKKDMIPFNYELHMTRNSIEGYNEMKRYVLFCGDTPIHSRTIQDITLDWDEWAKELFAFMEASENKSDTIMGG